VAQVAEAATLGSDGTLAAVQTLAQTATAKRAAATLAAKKAFEASTFPGVGEETWRTLWESARRYSTNVVEAHFPPSEPETACVLCQQPLTGEARDRMAHFEEYIRSDVEQQAQKAETEFSNALKAFDKKTIRIRTGTRRQVAIGDATLGRDILRFLATARHRRHACRRALDNREKPTLRPLAQSPETRLQKLEASVRNYAQELLEAVDLKGRARLEAERDELEDRLSLDPLLEKARAEVARLALLKRLGACTRETNTTAITNLGNAIADQVITPKIRDRFQEEIVGLAASRVRVEIVRAGGKYGSPVYQVKLFANKNAPVQMVLSEGEQTCVALAAFLTELATASHHSALGRVDELAIEDRLGIPTRNQA
jgi:hypothetical protein